MQQTPYLVELEIPVPVLGQASADQAGALRAPESTGAVEVRRVEGIVLENEFVVATFVPALGGRLLSLVDKATSIDCLSGLSTDSADVPGSPCGGLEITLDGQRRANAFGPVRAAVTEEGLRLSEVGARGGIGIDVLARLGEGAELVLDLRFHNRTRQAVAWNPGVRWGEQLHVQNTASGPQVSAVAGQIGFVVAASGAVLRHIGPTAATLFQDPRPLAPRWRDSFSLSIVPFSPVGQAMRVTSIAAVSMTESELVIQPRRRMAGAKLVLQTSAGRTLEAPADLLPTVTLRYTFAELGGVPNAFAILDADRVERFRFPVAAGSPEMPAAVNPYPDLSAADLSQLEREPAYRYWVANLRTQVAFVAADYAAALREVETALLYNAEDHLAWIEKAIAARHLAESTPDAPELPNAHYLAPLEPLLRAEGFLAQPGLDARTFLAPLADQPQELVDVACFYLDLGLLDDAAFFIDAALAVTDVPMLRYLYAYACLLTGRMATEAAASIARVDVVAPPYPWRIIERSALRELRQRFPENQILEEFSGLVDA